MKKVHPIMVSTYEALACAVESNWCAIYIELCLFHREETTISNLMQSSGYRQSDITYRKGILFTNTDLNGYEIFDPMGIL